MKPIGFDTNCSMKLLDFIIHSLMMFFAIFNPPVLRFNTIHIIAFISWIYLFINYSWVKRYINIHKLFFIYFSLILLGFYLFMVATFSYNNPIVIAYFIFWSLEVIPYCLFVKIYFLKHNYNLECFLQCVFFACFIQSSMAILALLIPSVKEFFVDKIINYGYSNVHKRLSLYRNFGFADSLTFTSAIVQSIIACIALQLYIKKMKLRYLLVFLFGAFAGVINARTSFVILLSGSFCMLLSLKSFKDFWHLIRIGLFSIIAIVILLNILRLYNDWTYSWVVDGSKQIFAFFMRDESNYGYFNYFSEKHFPLPNNYHILFGYGVEIMHGFYYGVKSDIGFINDVWRTGLCGSAVIYSLYFLGIREFLRSKLLDCSMSKFFFSIFFIFAILINIKGYFFVYNNVTTLIWLLFVFCCLQKTKTKISDNNDFMFGR